MGARSGALGRRTRFGHVSTHDQRIEELNGHLLVYLFAIHQLVQPDRPIVEPLRGVRHNSRGHR